MEEIKHLDIMHDEFGRLREISYALQSLSKSFFRTGNSYIGEELLLLGAEISESEKAMSASFSKDISRQCLSAQESANATITMALTHILDENKSIANN